MIDPERGETLLRIARGGLHEAAGASSDRPPNAAWLEAPGASFVTLRTDGELRGCIGSIEPVRALGVDVFDNAIAAATRDPRFAPVRRSELDGIRLEVSVLSPLERVASPTREHALAAIEPNKHGALLRFGQYRATLLPQVWESVRDGDEFFRALNRKMGLPQSFWHSDIQVFRYTVKHFSEPGFERGVS